MNDALVITISEGITNSGLRVFLAEANPHSEEYKRFMVMLVENGEKFICGKKGMYKSLASAKKIFNQVVAAY